MTARDNLFWALWDNYTKAQKNEFINAFAHELAQQIRAFPRTQCVNDTDGDGNCAACARDPKALCRQPIPAEQLLGHAADLIDPETEREPST